MQKFTYSSSTIIINILCVIALVLTCALAYAEESRKPKLTLSMIMRNEADRYLRPMLESAREYIDEAVIIDDASSDNSVEVCQEVLKGIPLHLIRNATSRFGNEVTLRKQQWEETVKTKPEWVLILDADEIFEKRFKDEVLSLITRADVDVFYFRLYDFWDEEHYREDGYWRAHLFYRPFLVRYKEGAEYRWQEMPQHCGRMPQTIFGLPSALSDMRLKHYGWAKPEDRHAKYKRYKMLDPQGTYGSLGQYESILDEKPTLIKWEE
jgi:glycosyltransferase involved in cell wall biosynthesis